MAWQDMVNQVKRAKISFTEWNKISGNMSEIGDAWTGYTPSIGGTGWVVGSTDIAAGYRSQGKRLVGRATVVESTGVTPGSGGLTVGLPAGTGVAAAQHVGVTVVDVSAGLAVPAAGYLPASSTAIVTNVTSTTLGWAAGDFATVFFEVEVT